MQLRGFRGELRFIFRATRGEERGGKGAQLVSVEYVLTFLRGSGKKKGGEGGYDR